MSLLAWDSGIWVIPLVNWLNAWVCELITFLFWWGLTSSLFFTLECIFSSLLSSLLSSLESSSSPSLVWSSSVSFDNAFAWQAHSLRHYQNAVGHMTYHVSLKQYIQVLCWYLPVQLLKCNIMSVTFQGLNVIFF